MGRKIKQVFTIFVEGFSEEIYFSALKQQDFVRQSNYKLEIINCEGLNHLLDAALKDRFYKKQIKDSAKVAFVFDKDHLTKQQFEQMLATGYIIGFTNPQFEIWLLAHFEKLRMNYADVFRDLKKYIPEYSENNKTTRKITDLIRDIDRAIENSRDFSTVKYDEVSCSIENVITEIGKGS